MKHARKIIQNFRLQSLIIFLILSITFPSLSLSQNHTGNHLKRWNHSLTKKKIDAIKPPDFSHFGRIACVDGQACLGTTCYPCNKVDLLAFMPLSTFGASSANDIWGWTDPTTGKEYALLGLNNGVAFVDISDPENPTYIGKLPSQTGSSTWRDVKVYQNYAFVVSEASGHGMQVFDLTRLRSVTSPPVTFTADAVYNGDNFNHAHNIAVNEDTGFAYIVGSSSCAGGLHFVNIQNPLNPTFAGCFSADGYTHDVQCVIYHGPDLNYNGREICFAANEDTLTLVDVTDKSNPLMIARVSYPGVGYTHQGWLSEDHHYFFLDDELDEQNFGHPTRTRVFDVSDLDQPVLVLTYDASTPAIDHNLYVRGPLVYQANYRAGLRILLFGTTPSLSLSEYAFFDTYPSNDQPSFNSAWSVYPFFDSGVVIVSDIEQGLFVLEPLIVPDIALKSYSINDSCPSGGPGDGNGVVDPGEIVTLSIPAEYRRCPSNRHPGHPDVLLSRC